MRASVRPFPARGRSAALLSALSLSVLAAAGCGHRGAEQDSGAGGPVVPVRVERLTVSRGDGQELGITALLKMAEEYWDAFEHRNKEARRYQ